MTNTRLTNFRGENVSCVQVIKNEVAELSVNVPDGDAHEIKLEYMKAYESGEYKVNIIPLYNG